MGDIQGKKEYLHDFLSIFWDYFKEQRINTISADSHFLFFEVQEPV